MATRKYHTTPPVGEVFGMWTVVGPVFERGEHKTDKWFVPCRCDCGTERGVRRHSLLYGGSSGCGCAHQTWFGQSRKKEASRETDTYRIWTGMKGRCSNPRDKAYRLYGARGISVCPRWTESYENFLADMGERPSSEYSIDRINTNGDYEPSNCRWATGVEQARNTRRNAYLEFRGELLCVSAMAERYDMQVETLRARLEQGMSLEDALLTPVAYRSPRKKAAA